MKRRSTRRGDEAGRPALGWPRGAARRWWVGGGLVLVAVLAVFSLVTAIGASRHANRARTALLRAESQLSARDLAPAREGLAAARRSLALMDAELDRLGPLVPLAKLVPVVRSQVIAVETIQEAGTTLVDAGVRLADAAQRSIDSTEGATTVARAVATLRAIDESLASGAASVREAAELVEGIEGRWLIGPVDQARDDLVERLPGYARRVTTTSDGLRALVRFAGGDGPRRHLLLSQNPDEIRPTGGFIGTYGVMSADGESMTLDRFEPIGPFRLRHPEAVVPGSEAGSPFRFAIPPKPQDLGNVNSTPDFARAGELAARLWREAGQPPVNGVVSFTPAFLARLLGVLGPVTVDDYGETVAQENVVERFDFYTAQSEADPAAEIQRKGFIGSLAEVVFGRLLEVPSNRWAALAGALGDGFAAREAMAWSSDPEVQAVLAERGWDGVLPEARGDFFYNGEFSYGAKFNRVLGRTFDHHVQLRDDGSARITTTIHYENPRPASRLNVGSLSYVTLYGPAGARIHESSDPPVSPEPAISGHPAAGWFVNAPPLGRATLRVAWEVDDLLEDVGGGARSYSLTWLKVPDHTGDVLNLRVAPPPGWRWHGEGPPAQVELDRDFSGSWSLVRGTPPPTNGR